MNQPEYWNLPAVGWTAIAALASAGTLVVGTTAATIAILQLRQNARLNQNKSRPYIVVDFLPSPASNALMDFVIRNIGATPAYGLKISWDPTPVEAQPDPNLEFAKARIFSEPIQMIAPNREIRIFFDSMPERQQRTDLTSLFTVTLQYRSGEIAGSQSYSETSVLDLDLMNGASYVGVKQLHDLVKAVEIIGKKLK